MTSPLLEVRHLSKKFTTRSAGMRRPSTIHAVEDVSFELASGETLGLVGESGCGKSTLGRTVLRLLTPNSGEVVFAGSVVGADDTAVLRRRAQMVFQDPYSSLPPRMRVGRILAEPLLIHNVVPRSKVAARVRSLLGAVGMSDDHARAFPHQLSGGQRQRVSIARALAVEPSLIVADEAVSSLDVSVQAQILNLLRDLQVERGIAYLFISHDLGVVRYMSHRVAVMYLGRIVEVGPAPELTGRPLHPYTVGLLSAVPKISADGAAVRIDTEPPEHPEMVAGCAFQPRCPMAQPVCVTDRPELTEWEPGRWSACHFALEVPGRLGQPIATPGGAR